jgi:ubiquinone biosynthesis accessory factor UbiJ
MHMISLSLKEKIQSFINTVLQQDEMASVAVQEIAGKVIKIEISGPDISLFVKFEQQGMVIETEYDAKPNVIIRARPSTYIGLLINRDEKTNTFTPDMEISGDANLAQRFQQIMRNMEIDWEEHLSHWVGDTAAHKLGRVFKQSRELIKEVHQTIQMDISEYLRYEKNMLPDRDEVAEYIAAVDVLRNDAERLQLRIARLQKIISEKVRHYG